MFRVEGRGSKDQDCIGGGRSRAPGQLRDLRGPRCECEGECECECECEYKCKCVCERECECQ